MTTKKHVLKNVLHSFTSPTQLLTAPFPLSPYLPPRTNILALLLAYRWLLDRMTEAT
jgi:hypothetical protein